MTETVQRIVLASRPVGEPTLDNFRLEEHPILQPEPGQMLLRTLWLSLDPYMRGRMSDAPSYAKPVGIGDVMEGVAVIDPHGDLAEDILNAIPRSRINDVCYLDAGETEYPVGFNPATRIASERRALAASGIVAAFKHLWSDSWGPRLEHFLFHGVAALISRQHATLIDLARLYIDDGFRKHRQPRDRSRNTALLAGGVSELHQVAAL